MRQVQKNIAALVFAITLFSLSLVPSSCRASSDGSQCDETARTGGSQQTENANSGSAQLPENTNSGSAQLPENTNSGGLPEMDPNAETSKEAQESKSENNQESDSNKSTENETGAEAENKPLTVDDIPEKLREALLSNKRGKHLECIEICNQIISLDKDNLQALAYRGRSHAATRKPKEAVEDLTRVIEKSRGSHQVLGSRALAYLQLEEYQKAIEDCTKAIAKNAKNQEYFIIRALSLHRMKENKKALEDINDGLALDPEGPNQAIFLLARADVFTQMNRDDDCLKDLNKIIKLKPKDPQSYMNRANFYIKSKNWERVIADLDSVIDYAPMGHLSNEALMMRAEAERKFRKYKEAESDYSSLLAGYPKDTSFLYGRADARFNLRSFAGALKDINKCIELEKTNPKFFDLRAKIFDAMEEKEKSAADRSQLESLNAMKSVIEIKKP